MKTEDIDGQWERLSDGAEESEDRCWPSVQNQERTEAKGERQAGRGGKAGGRPGSREEERKRGKEEGMKEGRNEGREAAKRKGGPFRTQLRRTFSSGFCGLVRLSKRIAATGQLQPSIRCWPIHEA